MDASPLPDTQLGRWWHYVCQDFHRKTLAVGETLAGVVTGVLGTFAALGAEWALWPAVVIGPERVSQWGLSSCEIGSRLRQSFIVSERWTSFASSDWSAAKPGQLVLSLL